MEYVPSSPSLYLEDFQVGQHFSTHPCTIDEKHAVDFARQFDPQPFHLDASAARDSFFQGLVTSGWYTAASTMRMIVDSLPIAGGVIGAGGEVSWPRPTRPGDILRVEGEIIHIKQSKSHADRGIVTIRTKTLNQKEEIVQDMTSKLVVFRRPN
ncbi:MAG: MaoC/PaaZ C-terminal domain-containing protein [Alphaproteobacteria bacterium]